MISQPVVLFDLQITVQCFSACVLFLTHHLDVLQGDPVLSKLLVDEDEGVEVSHPPIEHLIRQPARAFHHGLMKLQQSGRVNARKT